MQTAAANPAGEKAAIPPGEKDQGEKDQAFLAKLKETIAKTPKVDGSSAAGSIAGSDDDSTNK